MNEKPDRDNFLEMRDLQLLDILHSTRSVTRTAARLGQSQPTVSVWLRRIRERVKDPLFVRTSEGMTPTPRALAVVGKAREILEAMHQITGEAPRFDPSTSTRVFRLCAPDSAQITMLPRLVQYVNGVAPSVRLEVLSVDDDTARRLESGEADLAYGGFVPGMEAGFHQQALFEQDFACLVSARHPRIRGRMSLQDYQREAHVSVSYGGVNAVIDAAMKRQNIDRRVLVYLQGFLGVPKIIATTDMITTLPRQIGENLASGGAVRQVDCPVAMPKYMVKQYWHTRFHRDPGNKWLRAICARQARY